MLKVDDFFMFNIVYLIFLPSFLFRFFCIVFNTHFHYLIFNFGSFLPKDAHVNIVDLLKSFRMLKDPSFQRVLNCKNRRRYSKERASQSLEENSIHYSFASLLLTPHLQVGLEDVSNAAGRRVAKSFDKIPASPPGRRAARRRRSRAVSRTSPRCARGFGL